MLLQEDGPRGATAERLDSDRAAAGVSVEKDRAFCTGPEHVEQRLPKAVGRGAQRQAGQGFQAPRAKFPPNDAHLSHSTEYTYPKGVSYGQEDRPPDVVSRGDYRHGVDRVFVRQNSRR